MMNNQTFRIGRHTAILENGAWTISGNGLPLPLEIIKAPKPALDFPVLRTKVSENYCSKLCSRFPDVSLWLNRHHMNISRKYSASIAYRELKQLEKRLDRNGFNLTWSLEEVTNFAKLHSKKFFRVVNSLDFNKQADIEFNEFNVIANFNNQNQIKHNETLPKHEQVNIDLIDKFVETELSELTFNYSLGNFTHSPMISIFYKLKSWGIDLFPASGDDYEQRLFERVQYFAPRVVDETWLDRKLRRLQARELANIARETGIIQKRVQPYSADLSVNRKKAQDERNKSILKNCLLVNYHDEEESQNLIDVVQKSVSNPRNRIAELMVRMRGCEEIADELGHVGLMLTFTTPSRFHATKAHGNTNNKWIKAGKPTVSDAHTWLKKVWASVLPQWERHEIKPYGFRVVEPHHDGTPHWHLMLFVEPSKVGMMLKICRRRLLADSPDELGAQTKRFHYTMIDKKRGSAAGYIAKYISKGISGEYHTSDKSTDLDAVNAAQAIRTWASDHGIRQFQPIGQPSVQVWRELRKFSNAITNQGDDMQPLFNEQEHFALENVRRAADEGDWNAFVKAMGGLYVKRADRKLSVHYAVPELIDRLTGEIFDLNKYGEKKAKTPAGLMFEKIFITTRFKDWQIRDKAAYAQGERLIMRGVKQQFDAMMEAEAYQAMLEEDYERHLEQCEEIENMRFYWLTESF
ncbi:replication endonuclease [Motilimonas cestriensis]|uniref:Replication endonuclease n=1 Tax=Motilimonas cestriensis TaxID=2742685 RepID=A0ABS8WDW8_9GAMM|nr:replication endonuclease [Motilimonas cestriensis]MCE2597234.1 replication endonuclease [Motilimonas cestriensis]